MLSKIVWKIIKDGYTTWMQLVKHKYLKNMSIIHRAHKPGDSMCWKGVARCAQSLQQQHVWWQIGDGKSILFWLNNGFRSKGLGLKLLY